MSSTLPERMLRDLFISVMWSQISSTDDMLCVEKMIVAPLSRRARISSLSRLALIGSKPEKGSSKISSSGSWSTVTMNCTFWAMPFESSSTFLSHHVSMPNFPNHRFSRTTASRRESPFRRAKKTACSPTFIFL